MATSRNKKKLAAVSRETPEGTKNSRVQNTLDPEISHYYISQVSEEIEGSVTEKLSKEFSRTESRILGALSKLDKFLLNPQVRICSSSCSRNIQEQTFRKPGNHWGSFLRRFLPRSEMLFSPLWSSEPPRGRRLSSQSDRSYRRNSSVPSHDDRNSRKDSLVLP